MLFLSNLVVGGFKGFEYSYGEFLVLIATLLWGVENILAKKVLKSVDPDIVVLFRMGLGSLILTIFTLLTVPGVVAKTLSLNFQQIFWIVLTSLLLFLYVKNWYKALKYSSAIFVTSVLVSSTLITNILSAIFVTHSWNFSLSFQSIFILLGVLIFVLNEKNTSLKINLRQN
jgi:drug/metabolite transporter (DMT)-like permease